MKRLAWLGVLGLVFPVGASAKTITLHKTVDCGVMNSGECTDKLVSDLGDAPGFRLKATLPTDEVQGSVSVAFCDPITLGSDVLQFKDGTKVVASASNVGAWLTEQGHQVTAITGSLVTCDSLITVETYDQDQAPTPKDKRKSTLKKPLTVPSKQELEQKLLQDPMVK